MTFTIGLVVEQELTSREKYYKKYWKVDGTWCLIKHVCDIAIYLLTKIFKFIVRLLSSSNLHTCGITQCYTIR